MEPCCQFCYKMNPEWNLVRRSDNVPGPEICQDCIDLIHKVTQLMEKLHD